MGQTREALFESKNPVEKSETTTQTAFFYPLFSAWRKRIKIFRAERRTEREHTQVCFAKRETGSVFEEMRAPLSLSLSGWWHATTTTTTGENENEREREKIENCFAIYFVPFRACVKKFFPNRFFFLPLLRFQNAPRAMRSNNNNNDTNRREKERERERPLFPFHAIVKMRFF